MAPAWLTPLFERTSPTVAAAPASVTPTADARGVGDAVVCPDDYSLEEWVAVNSARSPHRRSVRNARPHTDAQAAWALRVHVCVCMHVCLCLCVCGGEAAVDFFNQVTFLYAQAAPVCTAASCPLMNAGPRYAQGRQSACPASNVTGGRGGAQR
jgi:hypothetical protein